MSDQPRALRAWHGVVESKDVELLDDLLSDDVVFRSLTPPLYVFRRALSDGRRLGDAAAAAAAEDAGFDLAEALRALLDERVLVGFTIS